MHTHPNLQSVTGTTSQRPTLHIRSLASQYPKQGAEARHTPIDQHIIENWIASQPRRGTFKAVNLCSFPQKSATARRAALLARSPPLGPPRPDP